MGGGCSSQPQTESELDVADENEDDDGPDSSTVSDHSGAGDESEMSSDDGDEQLDNGGWVWTGVACASSGDVAVTDPHVDSIFIL